MYRVYIYIVLFYLHTYQIHTYRHIHTPYKIPIHTHIHSLLLPHELPSASRSIIPVSDPIHKDEFLPIVYTLAKAARKARGKDIVAQRVKYVSQLTNFFMYITVESSSQLISMPGTLEDRVQVKHGAEYTLGQVDGTPESGWRAFAIRDVLIHLMLPSLRLKYDIEGFWTEMDGEDIDLTHILLDDDDDNLWVAGRDDPLVFQTNLDEEDPFWS